MDVTNIEENLKFVLFGQFVHPFLEIFTNTLRVIFFISNLLRSLHNQGKRPVFRTIKKRMRYVRLLPCVPLET